MKRIMSLRWLTTKLLIVVATFSLSSYAATITNLTQGGMKTLSVSEDIQSVFIADDNVADYQVIDNRKVVIFGKQVGYTSIAIFGEESKTLLKRKLWVNQNLDFLQQQIQMLYPDTNVTVANIAESIVLSGYVDSEQERDQINELVGTILGQSSEIKSLELSSSSSSGSATSVSVEMVQSVKYERIINNIKVNQTKQVNVKLTVAEVSHTLLEDFGVEYGSSGSGTGVFVDQLTSFSASDIVSVITAIGNDSVGQVLAEPNLSVLSGEGASFLVGGELPVVTVIDGATSVEYKEYGIKLDMMAKVERDEQIRLTLMPEVSSLDAQYQNESYDLPSLKTRRASTTVQLGDGKSFVLGGLLSTEDRESIGKIPYAGDIPILGALFRHSQTERNRTELIIVATVNLVKPVEPELIQLPTMMKTSTLGRFFAIEESYQASMSELGKELLLSGGFLQ